MRSQGVPSPFFPAQRGISDHLPLPTKGIPQGCFLKGPRFWSRARSRLLARAAHVSGGKICPEFAPRRSRPHSALPSFDCKLLFAPGHYPLFRRTVHFFSVQPVRTAANRDSALQSNFTKQYAPTRADPKKHAAQNHASPLSSYLTHRVARTPLHRATMLAPTTNSK